MTITNMQRSHGPVRTLHPLQKGKPREGGGEDAGAIISVSHCTKYFSLTSCAMVIPRHVVVYLPVR